MLKYFKSFIGPIPVLAPLMIPIEIISHFSRPVSLSIRLFSNIFAEDVLIVVIASIIPFFLPLPFMAVAIFTSAVKPSSSSFYPASICPGPSLTKKSIK